MKLKVTLLAMFMLCLLQIDDAYGQQGLEKPDKEKKEKPDKNRDGQHSYYKKTLATDSVLAEKVVEIQADYKAGLGLIVEDASLSEEVKRAKIDALINEKNRKLEAILTPEQQEKVIPTTEREPKKVRED